VPKTEFASQDWYDVWLPNLAPSPELMKLGRAVETEREWATFVRKYRAEMADPDRSRVLDLLAALSHTADFSVGCYCAPRPSAREGRAPGARVGAGSSVGARRRGVPELLPRCQSTLWRPALRAGAAPAAESAAGEGARVGG
jgi:uncharacterized protein YeaO (DUF488 family)